MALLYTPVVEYTGRLVGYVPVWFVGVFPASATLFLSSILALALPHVAFVGWPPVDMTWWLPLWGTVFLVSFIVMLWHWSVMESLFMNDQTASYPAVRQFNA